MCCAGGVAVTDDTDKTGREEIEEKRSGTLPTSHDITSADGKHKQRTEEELTNEGIQLPWLNRFLGTTYANFLMRTPTKICVMLVYAGLLAGAVYGILRLEEGLDTANLAPDSSYYRDFEAKFDKDFSEIFGPTVQVAVDETLDYTQQSVRDDYDNLITKFRNNKFFVTDENFVISWLDRFVGFLSDQSIDVASLTMTEFIERLQNDFFAEEGYQYHAADVVISSDNTRITASRFFVQTRGLDNAVEEKDMMLDAREIADDYKWDVEVFAPGFIFFDQYVVILDNTLQNLGIAVGAIAVVSLVLLPSITAVLWVTLATVSICGMVIGYMSLWGVSLDSVSMINLVMCIGFSVDFAAHISYHFVASPSTDSNENARDALGALGTPIVQGAVSTVIAVAALSTASTYIFRTFFKLVFLVMLLGFFHAMAVLPVVLSTLNCNRCKKKSEVSDSRANTPSKEPQRSRQANGEAFDNPAMRP